ncbi:MAG: RloB domain-containing protein [Bacteroidetes bacterium]|nr:MAG: RloB domain-containing protein [Bacteroidota bacterium]
MGSKRAAPKGKKIKPTFWVFCEGETEAAYIAMLRSQYRIPIEITTKVAGNSITEKYITKCKQGRFTHKKDKDFLVYDADVIEFLQRLHSIKGAKLIASNPCIELWFLLHYKNQTTFINGKDYIKEIENRNRTPYQKGVIDPRLAEKLKTNQNKACERARKLTLFKNPSTGMYEMIDELEALTTTKWA